MNLGNLITEAQRLSGRVDTQFRARTRRWINEAQEEWSLEVPWPTLIREESFRTDGTAQLILPPRVKVMLWAGDAANQRPIDMMKHWDREFPGPFFGKTTGAACVLRPMGVVAASKQPAAVGPITVKTTASDSVTIHISGLAQDTAASGTSEQFYPVREALIIASDSEYTSVNSYVKIDSLGKDDFTLGDFVFRDSSSNVVARLNKDEYRTGYRRVDLLYIPPIGTEIVVQYLTGPETLVDDTQVPHPAIDPEYLIWYAAGMTHEAMSEAQQSQIKLARAKEILNRRIHRETGFGDQDWRALPEAGFWANEDQYLP
jgi:hypothetical protein